MTTRQDLRVLAVHLVGGDIIIHQNYGRVTLSDVQVNMHSAYVTVLFFASGFERKMRLPRDASIAVSREVVEQEESS